MITLEIVATIRLNDHNDLTSVLLEMELVVRKALKCPASIFWNLFKTVIIEVIIIY